MASAAPEPINASTDLDVTADVVAQRARSAHRRAQILYAAAQLMERRSSHAVSMQAIAQEAGVSVGLIYRYFAGKDDLLLAVILDVLDQYASQLPAAIAAAGDDPVDRLRAGFGAYCEVIDRNRHAAVLTYRESKTLSGAGIETIKAREVESIEPLVEVLRHGVEAGVFRRVDVDVVAYDLLVIAHAWALKRWYFERRFDVTAYVDTQFELVLASVLPR